MEFIRSDLLNLGISGNIFDVIVCVSTIEHIGLQSHGQETLDEFGDIKAMEELNRVLKPEGILILTTPYVGKESIEPRLQGNYNRDRIEKLIESFEVVKQDYFYTMCKGRWAWIKMNKQDVDEQNFNWRESFHNWGLACLVLKKGDKVFQEVAR